MKTTRLIAFTLLSMLGLVAHHSVSPAGQLMTDQPTTIVTGIPSPPAIGGWYLMMEDCGSETMICCCSDGNGYICDGNSVRFYCKFGGYFECTGDLGNCEENPSTCDSCCPGGRC